MDQSFTVLVIRMLASLAVVIAILGLAARWMRRKGLTGGFSRPAAPWARIEVLGRSILSKSSSVALVRVAGKTLLLGVTDHNVSVLSELPDEAGIEDTTALADAHRMSLKDSLTASLAAKAGQAGQQPVELPLTASAATAGQLAAKLGNGDRDQAARTAQPSLMEALRERTVRRTVKPR
jgi:flagellar biogenesis protein FliO